MVTAPPDVSIIIPTYREAENLPILIPRIDAAMRRAGLIHEVLVVDDDSQDGTVVACHRLAQNSPIRLITRRTVRGLASAVVCGLREAAGDVLVVMDADLSHPPESLPDLVTACRSPCADFVVGSRHVEGGSIDRHWTFYRHLNSRIASWLARGLTAARDPMSGFFALKRATFDRATDLQPLGYKIGLELIVRCHCRQIIEIPIDFRDRARGSSKLTLGQQWLYLRHLGRLYPAKYAGISRFSRFGLVGLSGTVVDLAVLGLLLQSVSFALARALAIWVAMTWNFILHRGYTFRAPTRDSTLHQYGRFVGVCLLGSSVNWLVSMLVASTMRMLPGRIVVASVIGVMAGAVFNYFLLKHTVFGPSTSIEASRRMSPQYEVDLEGQPHPFEQAAPGWQRKSA